MSLGMTLAVIGELDEQPRIDAETAIQARLPVAPPSGKTPNSRKPANHVQARLRGRWS